MKTLSREEAITRYRFSSENALPDLRSDYREKVRAEMKSTLPAYIVAIIFFLVLMPASGARIEYVLLGALLLGGVFIGSAVYRLRRFPPALYLPTRDQLKADIQKHLDDVEDQHKTVVAQFENLLFQLPIQTSHSHAACRTVSRRQLAERLFNRISIDRLHGSQYRTGDGNLYFIERISEDEYQNYYLETDAEDAYGVRNTLVKDAS